MARARDVPGLDCDAPFARAAKQVVKVRSAEVFEHSEDVLSLEEIEHVHEMRVATRRLRAALEVFEPCFPAKRHRKALKRVEALADALGERRDRDVAIEFLERFFSAEAPERDRAAIGVLASSLREEQRRANDELAPYVEARRLKKLRRRLRRLAEAAQR